MTSGSGSLFRSTCACIAVTLFAGSSVASDFKRATESEIRRYFDGASQLKEGKNGYEYRPGESTGYKISNGQICVLHPNGAKDCVKIQTDGRKMRMIDRTGTRTRL